MKDIGANLLRVEAAMKLAQEELNRHRRETDDAARRYRLEQICVCLHRIRISLEANCE